MGYPAACCLALFLASGAYSVIAAETIPAETPPAVPLPFQPGERLTYEISWSNIISAGTATLAINEDQDAYGRPVLMFVSTARSRGIVDTFYRVEDLVQSRFDPRTMLPLSYVMDQRHGKRKKHRGLLFDHAKGKVTYYLDGHEDIVEIPGDAQDALSSLYYLRTRETLTGTAPIVIEVHDSGKTWGVEVHVLGRERIKVPAGEFDTIKIKTHPKYEGVFMHKGEILIWLSDDGSRIPVLMKSTISIGSIMATLTDIKRGGVQ
jgi:hypothetical protein